MEANPKLNPAIVKWCMLDRNVGLLEVSRDTGISESGLSDLLSGKKEPSYAQLKKLSQYFNRGVLFFYEPELPIGSITQTPQYRTITNQSPSLTPKFKDFLKRVEDQRQIFLSLREEIDPDFANPAVLPNFSQKDTQQAAELARSWLGLGKHCDFELLRSAVESKHILVFRSNGYNGKWKVPKDDPIEGFVLTYDLYPVIVVKKHNNPARQAFTLAHELGHLLLHRESFIDEDTYLDSNNTIEIQANEFAGHLLIPSTWLSSVDIHSMPSSPSEYQSWLYKYTKEWGISTEMLIRRLIDAGYISRDIYISYREYINTLPKNASSGSREYRHREPRHVFGETYVHTVMEAMHEQIISAPKASKFLDNIKISDLRKLEKHLASA